MATTLLIPGADRHQLAALRLAREAGFDVVATGEGLRTGEDVRRLAERVEPLAADDVAGHVRLAQELGPELAGALGATDRELATVAAVGQASGTPACSPAAVELALDGARARAAWSEHGLATSGAAGDPPPARRLDVSAFFRDGALVPAGLLERFPSPTHPGITLHGIQSAELTDSVSEEVYALVEAAARALGIDVGPVAADVDLLDACPAIRRLVPRFHDAATTLHASALAHGKSPIQAWLAVLAGVGGPFDAMPERPAGAAGWMAIVPEQPGVFLGVDGLARARSLAGIEGIRFEKRPGDEVERVDDEHAVLGRLFATGYDAREVEERLLAGCSLLEVRMRWNTAA